MHYTFTEDSIYIYTIEVEYYKKITLDPEPVKVGLKSNKTSKMTRIPYYKVFATGKQYDGSNLL